MQTTGVPSRRLGNWDERILIRRWNDLDNIVEVIAQILDIILR